MHLAVIHKLVQDAQPKVVVLDPVGSLLQAGTGSDAHTMLIRLIDFLKVRGITAFLTNLTSGGDALETNRRGYFLDRRFMAIRARYRTRAASAIVPLYVLKSRGMSHSNQLREFLITKKGSICSMSMLGRRECLPVLPSFAGSA